MVKVLSIDGGGIRGLIPARVLEEIERRTRRPVAELFDLIALNRIGPEGLGCHSSLLLVAQGLEHLMKLVLAVGQLEQQGTLPPRDQVRKLGHDLETLANLVVSFSDEIKYTNSRQAAKEDLAFVRNDKNLRQLLRTLTAFGAGGRYYYLDTLLDPSIEEKLSDPTRDFESFTDSFLRARRDWLEIAKRPEAYRIGISETTAMIQRFARALCRMFTLGPLGSYGQRVYYAVEPFLSLHDEDLSTPAKSFLNRRGQPHCPSVEGHALHQRVSARAWLSD